ncbi:hypothetical protein [Peribacillus kribbensis]|uniref:hypothetical protein n=1 Tax=Peribacillus kribbensis TaxID=356658 RepID=UPI0004298766|nr:hypothetical protein [Peribacillus kribbensis]
MEFTEREALKLRLEQLAQHERNVLEQIQLERRELLDRMKELDEKERQDALHIDPPFHYFSALIYKKISN